MKKISKKGKIRLRELAKAKRELNKNPANRYCFFYGYLKADDYHHVIPRSYRKDLYTVKENLIPVSRIAHNVLTFGTNEEKKRLPYFQKYLLRMQYLDENYYNLYRINLEKNSK